MLALRRKKTRRDLNQQVLLLFRLKPQSSVQDDNPISAKTFKTDSVMEIYEPFLSDCFVSLKSDSALSTPI